MNTLTAAVKAAARAARMDLVGIAPVERFQHAPPRVHPGAHLPGARTVISLAIRYPDALFVHAGCGLAESIFGIERYQNLVIGRRLQAATLRLTRLLEDHGHATIPMPVSGKWRVHAYKDIPTDWCADFSHRHAAVAAGLGEFGLHALVITPQFGMRQRFVSMITAAPLDPDPLYAGPPLCDHCLRCVKDCPVQAFDARRSALESVTIGERTFQYAKVDHWRCAWSEQLNLIPEEGPACAGQTYGVLPPATGPVDETVMLNTFYAKCHAAGLQAAMTHAMGNCMRVCIPPHLRGTQQALAPLCPKTTQRSSAPTSTPDAPRPYHLVAS